MSHFTVLVIGDDHEKQLAPFQENNMGDCPKEYLAFTEDEDAEVDDITGKKGWWQNPNAKWDWHVIGGRWAGFFKLKSGALAPTPEPHWGVAMGIAEPPKEAHADQVKKADVDWDGMRADAEHDAALEYDYVCSVLGGPPSHKSWAVVRAEHADNIEAARSAYWAQPDTIAWKKAGNGPRDERRKAPVDFVWADADKFLCTRAEYIARARHGVGVTFALLKDGKWYERGEMGCWACVSNEKDPETWNSMFAKLIDELPADTKLTVVDCHI